MIINRVYVAGPYTQGDPVENTRIAIEMGDALLIRGFAPFVPHLSHYWHTLHAEHDYDDWMRLDLAWLMMSDAVLRLPGDSKGADLEVATAQKQGIRVYYSLDSLIEDAT